MNIEEQLKQILKISVIEERYLELIKLLNKDRDRLIKQNKRYKQALEFYAEKNNYQWEVSYRPQQEIDCMVIDDSGHIARKALENKNREVKEK